MGRAEVIQLVAGARYQSTSLCSGGPACPLSDASARPAVGSRTSTVNPISSDASLRGLVRPLISHLLESASTLREGRRARAGRPAQG
jgi:hypothetical protein